MATRTHKFLQFLILFAIALNVCSHPQSLNETNKAHHRSKRAYNAFCSTIFECLAFGFKIVNAR